MGAQRDVEVLARAGRTLKVLAAGGRRREMVALRAEEDVRAIDGQIERLSGRSAKMARKGAWRRAGKAADRAEALRVEAGRRTP